MNALGYITTTFMFVPASYRCSYTENAHVGLMKLDIEGCEPLAIRGAQKLLSSGRVSILHMEYSAGNMANVSGISGAVMLRELHDMGYDAFLADCKHNFDDLSARQELSEAIAACDPDPSQALAHALVTGVSSSDIVQYIPPSLYDEYTEIILSGTRSPSPLVKHCCMTNMFFRLERGLTPFPKRSIPPTPHPPLRLTIKLAAWRFCFRLDVGCRHRSLVGERLQDSHFKEV